MALINPGFQGKPHSGKRLPPGQSEVNYWPVLTYGATPHVTTNEWSLTIDGEVNKPITLDWAAFNKLPKTTKLTDIHCVTRWSRLGMPWEGVAVDELIALAGGLTDKAHYVIASSYGGYTTNLPITDVTNAQALVATKAHDEPLTDEHGGPARLFVPHLYFWKSAKWIQKLTFTPVDHPGLWEVSGYHNYGDPWREQRYDTDA
ncbi:MAG TPA: molybdopterin-dependent oxidoreductase [Candidatus Saccharimonadales bacterium]|nr:molybdopterin-dependent oxidoreductase [Candidatus Saccharimonadales bacterium]